MTARDVVIIGAGHNALTAAFYLAKAGRKPLVLERRDVVGGAGTLANALGPLRASIVRDMDLERRGVTFIHPDPRLIAPGANGRALVFSRDTAATARAIAAFSTRDAAKYPEFCATFAKIGAFLGDLLETTPPSIDAPSAGELWDLLKTGRRFRALGRRESFALLRWGPMAVADLVAEWFETDLLQAAIAARAIHGTAMGPWSAGTGAVLLLGGAIDPLPGGSSVTARDGIGGLMSVMADAARQAGAEIRTSAPVARILVEDGRAAGVVLADGTEIPARSVVSGIDPKQTFLGLIDPIELQPGFITRMRNYRCPGTVAKIDFTLGALPAFRGVTGDAAAALRGRVHIGPGIDYLERAFDASKYGGISAAPYLDIAFPTERTMSVHMQYAPFTLRGREWSAAADDLASIALRTIDEYAPGAAALVESQKVFTPLDLKETFGLTGGHIHHGELALDQLFTMRPTLGWADYGTPIDGLYLCGSGTHPGLGLTGGSGQNAARRLLKSPKKVV